MTPDIDAAAIKAIETLIKHGVHSAPVSPFPILKSIPGVILLTFAELANRTGDDRSELISMFDTTSRDVVTSVTRVKGRLCYIITYNQQLPLYVQQRALARELGHIVMKHDGSKPEDVRLEEARVFARHLLCPRPLIAALKDEGVRLTTETLGNITGCYETCLEDIRITPGARVPPELNQMVREQFADYVENYVTCVPFSVRDINRPEADFGTYMDGYEE